MIVANHKTHIASSAPSLMSSPAPLGSLEQRGGRNDKENVDQIKLAMTAHPDLTSCKNPVTVPPAI
ncbi:hypothetical protein INR49_027779 [Caranx melampygus]|nr:hypothetical protein INR49_027779 [Caranx melampygus]